MQTEGSKGVRTCLTPSKSNLAAPQTRNSKHGSIGWLPRATTPVRSPQASRALVNPVGRSVTRFPRRRLGTKGGSGPGTGPGSSALSINAPPMPRPCSPAPTSLHSAFNTPANTECRRECPCVIFPTLISGPTSQTAPSCRPSSGWLKMPWRAGIQPRQETFETSSQRATLRCRLALSPIPLSPLLGSAGSLRCTPKSYSIVRGDRNYSSRPN